MLTTILSRMAYVQSVSERAELGMTQVCYFVVNLPSFSNRGDWCPLEPWGCWLCRGHATQAQSPPPSDRMINLEATMWHWLLWERWLLALVFRLLLLYFLTSTVKQEKGAVRDRNLLQGQDHDQPVPWQVQFNWGNGSQSSNQCRAPVKGSTSSRKNMAAFVRGKVCWWMAAVTAVSLTQSSTAVATACPAAGEPNGQLLLEHFLSSDIPEPLMAAEDHFELCLAKCRTHPSLFRGGP